MKVLILASLLLTLAQIQCILGEEIICEGEECTSPCAESNCNGSSCSGRTCCATQACTSCANQCNAKCETRSCAIPCLQKCVSNPECRTNKCDTNKNGTISISGDSVNDVVNTSVILSVDANIHNRNEIVTPVNINSTNINNIHFSGRYKNDDTEIIRIRNETDNNNCCHIIQPDNCNQTNGCANYECSDRCISPVVLVHRVPVPVYINRPVPVPHPVFIPQSRYVRVPVPVVQKVAVPHPVHVPIRIPQPIPVARPYPILQRVNVPVPQFVQVPRPVPVQVPIYQRVVVREPVPVPQLIPVPRLIPVQQPVRVPVPVPVNVVKSVPVPVPYPQPYQVSSPCQYPSSCSTYQVHGCGSCYYCGGVYNPTICQYSSGCSPICRQNMNYSLGRYARVTKSPSSVENTN